MLSCTDIKLTSPKNKIKNITLKISLVRLKISVCEFIPH
nr:MAG TPA: hypothetical protein [Caudoviricetes sp.]